VQGVVDAFARGVRFVREESDEAADIAAPYIGMDGEFIREALKRNLPDLDTLRNTAAMDHVMTLMQQLGYVSRRPQHFLNLSFLDKAQAAAAT
jgi:ABC-type nitrate/sulfonate/bicarbonate transport system substrate-binding protein